MTTIQNIWTHYQPILTKLIEKTCTLQQHLLTLNVKNTNKDTSKRRLYKKTNTTKKKNQMLH